MKNRMPQKKMRNSVELTAIKRFEKCRTCPAFQNTETVFCGDWGEASTSRKPWVSAKAEICGFRKVGPALHCRFLAYGVRSLGILGISQYNDDKYIMSEVPRNACQAEYNLYLQRAG